MPAKDEARTKGEVAVRSRKDEDEEFRSHLTDEERYWKTRGEERVSELRRFWAGVLEDMFECILWHPIFSDATGTAARAIHKQGKIDVGFLADDVDTDLGSFLWICEVLSLEPEWVRRQTEQLFRMLQHGKECGYKRAVMRRLFVRGMRFILADTGGEISQTWSTWMKRGEE